MLWDMFSKRPPTKGDGCTLSVTFRVLDTHQLPSAPAGHRAKARARKDCHTGQSPLYQPKVPLNRMGF